MTTIERLNQILKEAGFEYEVFEGAYYDDIIAGVVEKLIAERKELAAAIEEEREACAKIADDMSGIKSIGGDIGDAIRARGNRKETGNDTNERDRSRDRLER
jgi:hypothetical protein